MKIVYSTNSVCQLGGVELVTIVKANALAEIPGNQVWIVVADNKYSSMIRLKKASVIDLGVHYYEEDYRGYWYAIKDLWKKRKIHYQRLELLLNDINPDVIISTGMAAKQMIPKMKLKTNPVIIMELHSSKHYGLEQARGWREWIFAKLGEIYNEAFIYDKYDKIVVLTKAEKTGKWANWDKIAVIPNPVTKKINKQSTCTAKVAVTAARLTWAKNCESLINIWAKVIQKHFDWKLQIWGNGPEENSLRKQIDNLGLNDHVFLMGYTSKMQEEMAKSGLFVFTSRTEGFSLVTLEAMSVGIPAVAYNCPGGIRYVLKDGKTGFLVPMNDEDAFVEKVCMLIENEELRKTMGQAALQEAEQYRVEKIVQRWMELFQELVAKKTGQRKNGDV